MMYKASTSAPSLPLSLFHALYMYLQVAEATGDEAQQLNGRAGHKASTVAGKYS